MLTQIIKKKQKQNSKKLMKPMKHYPIVIREECMTNLEQMALKDLGVMEQVDSILKGLMDLTWETLEIQEIFFLLSLEEEEQVDNVLDQSKEQVYVMIQKLPLKKLLWEQKKKLVLLERKNVVLVMEQEQNQERKQILVQCAMEQDKLHKCKPLFQVRCKPQELVLIVTEKEK